DGELRKLLAEAAGELGISCIEAAIATGDQFICGAERKRALGRAFGAGACDM
ncbi:MAG: 5'-methylthioadenosine/adenosylhomocysteine nucleosidase, partial [Clostridiales bacterium]|nr:5'-methylthioadenosine/adenosylhomocysteine nucleosidase [Clostridiales bacterium]